MIHEGPQSSNAQEVLDAIARNDVERLLMIPIEPGLHHEDWRFVQDIRVKLPGLTNAKVRANALLAHRIALFRGQLDQQTVGLLHALKHRKRTDLPPSLGLPQGGQECGITSVLPGTTVLPLKPFAFWMAETVVLFRLAMMVRLSPFFTV